MTAPSDTFDATPHQSPRRKPMQFGLATLIGLVVVSAVVLALFRFHIGLGLLVCFFASFFAVVRKPELFTWVELLVVICIIGLLYALIITAIKWNPDASKRSQCRNNLKQIGLALHNYHEDYGSFPPAIVWDEDGKPMHSWRILILPYLEHQPLYNAYRFDEPWDGPHNRTLAQHSPEVYRCASDDGAKADTMTNYVAILGDETAWPASGARRKSDFTDGLNETILVVELAGSGIHWMEPRDLDVLQMAPLINPKAGQGISSRHPGGANVLFADGTVRFLNDNLEAEFVAALLTVDGAEKFERDSNGNILNSKLELSRKPRAKTK